MKQWLFDKIIVEKFNNAFGFIVLAISALISALAIRYFGIMGGVLVLCVIIATPVLIYSLKSNKFGYLLLMVLSTFMGFISRIFGDIEIPWGALIDVLLGLMLAWIMVEQAFSFNPKARKEFSLTNPISIIVFIWSGYLLLQIFNPAGTIAGWLFGLRDILRLVMIFIIAQRVLNSLKSVHTFVMYFITLGLLTALYGFYQEYVGLPSFELEWATETPERTNLLYIQQKWRKWSFVSDPGVYGLFMSFGALIALILSLGHFNWKKKVFFFISGILMIIAVVFSGTRTAYAIIPIGITLYVLLNITNIKTLIFACVSAAVFIVLIFGPFYGKSARRIRSAFYPEEDASMNLREMNRAKIQPYIYEHPIGGGLTTTGGYGEEYSPGHPLAGFPPDSGFLKTLLETGWIGFILELTMYFIVMAIGVTNYYNARDPVIKIYYAAFIAASFALTIALYAKDRIDQFPMNFILYGIFVLMYKLIKFDNTVPENQTNQYNEQ